MKIWLPIILLLFGVNSYSQEKEKKPQKIKIDHADELEGGVHKGEEVRKLRGNVVFSQDNVKMYCDSAYHYASKNVLEAFGRVKIVQDSLTITGNKLFYNGNTKIAQMKGNVVMKDKKMTLYTNHLDYNMQSQTGYYYNGGKLIENKNILISEKGTYHSPSNMSYFKENVYLKNPEYEIWCDTLEYETQKEIAYFRGPTDIKTESGGRLFARKGTYNTPTGIAHFTQQAWVDNENYHLMGDSLHYNEKAKRGFAHGNMVLFLKNDSILIYGETGISDEIEGISKVYGGNPLMKNISGNDTLYLTADTLISHTDSNSNVKKIIAYYHVKLFKDDLQAVCDSLTYNYEDSTIYFNYAPILWSDQSQLTGEHIKIQLNKGEIDKMYIDKDAFVASQDTFINFNQIKGKNMIASFKEGKINRLDVNGNGQSLYYVLENDSVLTGLNRAMSANIIFYFDDGDVKKINFLKKPEAKFIPPKDIVEPDKFLQGFTWLIEKRPELLNLSPLVLQSKNTLLKIPEEAKLPENSSDNEQENLINRENEQNP